MAIEHVLLDNPIEKRENIVFVGDTYNSDVKGANNAGIDVIWINHGMNILYLSQEVINMDASYTGNKIFELRKKSRLTQKELAEMLHVTDKAVSKWERGMNFPDLSEQ